MQIGPGFFSSALLHPDGLGRVYLADPPWRTVVCEVNSVERWRVQAPDLLRELWAAAAPDGRVMIAAQGGNTNLLTVGDVSPGGAVTWKAEAWNVVCRFAAVAWNGVGFVVFATLADGKTLYRIDLNSGFVQRSPIPVAGGTTLGYRRVIAGRDVNGSDDDILYSERPEGNGYVERVINGRTYRVPVEVEGLVIGLTNGRTEGVYLADNRRVLVCEEETRDPRLVARNGQYLACGYLENNRAFVTTFPPFEPLPVTPPIDPPPPPPSDVTPNHFSIVQRVFSEHPDLAEANTRESCGRLTEFIVWALSQADDAFGHLSKRPGENQFNGHAVDATIYLLTQQVVDLIKGSGAREDWIAAGRVGSDPGPARPDWNQVPKREGNDWIPAFNPTPNDPQPPPIDPPPGLYPDEVFKKYATAAGIILAPRVVPNWNDLSQAARDELMPHIRQRAIGQGDRYRKRDLNPTVMDLVVGGLLDLPVEQFDPLMDESIAAQKLLQPQSSALVRLRVEGTRFMRGTQPFLWAGCSAFDLPVRIAEGDYGFADWMAETGFTLARIVVASVYRSPRMLAQSLGQLTECLYALKERGLYTEVVAICDSGPEPPNYNLNRQEMLIQVREIGAICKDFDNSIVELFNERDHPTQSDLARDNGFAEELRALVSPQIPVSLGSSGGGALPLSFRGDYLTVHTDRSQSPDVNHMRLRALQDQQGKPVISDEPQPVSEVPASRPDRTTDPAYGTALGMSARQAGLAGVTFHCDAGLSARLSDLGPVQKEAARRFIAALKGQ